MVGDIPPLQVAEHEGITLAEMLERSRNGKLFQLPEPEKRKGNPSQPPSEGKGNR
jgi:hypothetical protein